MLTEVMIANIDLLLVPVNVDDVTKNGRINCTAKLMKTSSTMPTLNYKSA